MGSILTKSPVQKIEKIIILELKGNKVKDIFECIEIIHSKYPQNLLVNQQQFDDIFASLVSDTEPIFKQLSEKIENEKRESEYYADIYEALACFTFFSGESYETKIAFTFRLFDFDCSDSIELAELVLSVQCVVRALCKMVNIEPPSLAFLENLSKTCFQLIDVDHNRHIEFDEYMSWVTNNPEFQEFLLKYSGTQTYFNAKRRMKVLMQTYMEAWESISGPDSEENELESVRSVMDFEFKYQKKEYVDELFEILILSSKADDENFEQIKIALEASPLKAGRVVHNKTQSKGEKEMEGLDAFANSKLMRNMTTRIDPRILKEVTDFERIQKILIKKSIFKDIMKAWAAFSATDINYDNYLTINELKIMLWVYENEEPNEFRLKSELTEIDSDKSNSIDRIEWLRHLCLADKQSGKAVFRKELKEMFEKYDKDNSGELSLKELRLLLKDIFKTYLRKAKDEKTQYHLSMMIDNLSLEIIQDLNMDQDNSLTWSEFKLFIDKTMERQKKLKEFLDIII